MARHLATMLLPARLGAMAFTLFAGLALGACRARRLRCRELRGRAAHARGGHSAGGRCAAARARAIAHARGRHARRRGNGDRTAARLRKRAGASDVALRRRRDRSAHVHRRAGGADARWRARGVLAGASREPSGSGECVVTLALGIGANTAIFSVINGVVLRPLPFAKPDQLVYITSQFPKMNLDHFPLDGAEFIELRERNHSFKEVGAYAVGAVNVGADESPRRVASAIASASLFTAMGVPPLAGRTFREDETLPNGPTVAVISRDLWQTAFGGRSIVGQQIQVDGISRTVIGIVPSGFDVHDEGVQLWTSAHPRSGESQSVSRRPLSDARRPSQGRRFSRACAQRSGDDAGAVERPRRR